MNEVVIKQSRVCDLLRSAGLKQKKKDDFAFFLKHHSAVPGLDPRTTKHKPAKTGRSRWYVYETGRYLTVEQAEKEIAEKLAIILKLTA